MADDKVSKLLNSGVNIHKKAKKSKKENKAQVADITEVLDVDPAKPQRQKDPTIWDGEEDFCEFELRKAKLLNKPEPDFDYRDEYEKGDEIYYVSTFDKYIHSKEIIELVVRTVYPRMIVGMGKSNPGCVCIDYNMRNNVFKSYYEAEKMYNNVHIQEDGDLESEAEDDIKSVENHLEEEVV